MLPVNRCRKLLGDATADMTDEEIMKVRDSLYELAEIALDDYISKRKNEVQKTGGRRTRIKPVK